MPSSQLEMSIPVFVWWYWCQIVMLLTYLGLYGNNFASNIVEVNASNKLQIRPCLHIILLNAKYLFMLVASHRFVEWNLMNSMLPPKSYVKACLNSVALQTWVLKRVNWFCYMKVILEILMSLLTFVFLDWILYFISRKDAD